MMTKVYTVCAVLVALAVLMGVWATAETYALTTVVTSLDYDADVVECMDFTGNVWAFTGCEDWQLMDVCALSMDDSGTATIYDDVILSTRYNGWIDGWMERVG